MCDHTSIWRRRRRNAEIEGTGGDGRTLIKIMRRRIVEGWAIGHCERWRLFCESKSARTRREAEREEAYRQTELHRGRLEEFKIIVNAFLAKEWPHEFNTFISTTGVSRNGMPPQWEWVVFVVCERERLVECKALVAGDPEIAATMERLAVGIKVRRFLEPKEMEFDDIPRMG
jgi:hypothetical protein